MTTENKTSRIAGGLRRIDENKLNLLLNYVEPDLVKNITRRRLPTTSRKRKRSHVPPIPRIVRNVVASLGLMDINDMEKRAMTFIGYYRSKNYSYNTILRYFAIARANNLFDKTFVTPDPTAFVGQVHTRIVSTDDYIKLFVHLTEEWSEYTAPLLIAFYTGLRTMEILQFTTNTLHQLTKRQVYVNIRRKQTVIDADAIYWKPVYNSHLVNFVNKLTELYAERYETFERHGVNVALFHVTAQTLVNRMHLSFYKACGYNPPKGFGVHSCRYMIATLMASVSKDLVAIQTFLQHRKLNTTRRYLRTDFIQTRDIFDKLTKDEFANVRSNLVPPPALLSNENEGKNKKTK